MDQRQTFARTLPAKGHRDHEQWFAFIYQGAENEYRSCPTEIVLIKCFFFLGQSKPPGQIHVYTLQRTGYSRLVWSNGSVGEETTNFYRRTREHVPAKDQRIGRNAL